MVVYRGLVHPRSGDNGPHARILIPVISKQPLRGFKNPFACHVRWSRHVAIPNPFFKLMFEQGFTMTLRTQSRRRNRKDRKTSRPKSTAPLIHSRIEKAPAIVAFGRG